MKPELLASVIAALIAALAVGGVRGARHLPSSRPSELAPPTETRCPPGTLPDQGVCIPVPELPRTALRTLASGARIPRLPERSPSYADYVLPVASATASEETNLPADGGAARDGITLHVAPGAPVTALSLEGQEGATRVVYSGALLGKTVITEHVVSSSPGKGRQEYVVIVAELDDARPLAPRTGLAKDAPLGQAGASVYLETRLVREGTDVFATPPPELLGETRTVAVDVRNVLARRTHGTSL